MIVFIGDGESVKPYRLFGFHTYTAGTPEEAGEALEQISPAEAEAVFMTEELFEAAGAAARERGIHAVAVPAAGGSRGTGGRYIRDILRKALGTDVGG